MGIRGLIIVGIVWLGMLVLLVFSGCTLKIVPLRSAAAETEMRRRIAIESYKNGLFDRLEIELEEQEFRKWDGTY